MAVIHQIADSGNARWYMMLAGMITAVIVSIILLALAALKHGSWSLKRGHKSDSSILSAAIKKSCPAENLCQKKIIDFGRPVESIKKEQKEIPNESKEDCGPEPSTPKLEEERENSVNFDLPDNSKIVGQLEFCIAYDNSTERPSLSVTVLNAKALKSPASSSSGQQQSVSGHLSGQQVTLDPYVKLQLLPERKHKVKTRVVRRTRNPVYDETFTFYDLDSGQLTGTTLCFTLLSFDRFSQDVAIGQTSYSLADVPMDDIKYGLRLSEHIIICDTVSTSPVHGNRGDLLVSLCYQPVANRIVVVVLKARALPKMDLTGLSDPYVKIYLLYKGRRIAKKKTRVKKRTLDPVFNESFQFDMPVQTTSDDNQTTSGSSHISTTSSQSVESKNESFEQLLSDVSLEFLVSDWDRVTKNEVVGRLKLGAGAADQVAIQHWRELLQSPRKQLAEWHALTE